MPLLAPRSPRVYLSRSRPFDPQGTPLVLTKPNYLRILEEHLRNVEFAAGIHHVEIFHDDWCAVFEGDTCNCTPEVASGPMIDAKYTPSDAS